MAIAMARVKGLDLSQEDDLHIALWHKAGKTLALLAGLLDFLKGITPVVVCYILNLSPVVVTFSGVAAAAGQMWPPVRNWHGEKGNTTGGGAVITLSLVYQSYLILFALIPSITGILLALFFERGPSKAMPVGNLVAFTTVVVISWCSGQPEGMTLGFLTLLIILMVRRLTADLKDDLKARNNIKKILVNRFLFDQSLIDSMDNK